MMKKRIVTFLTFIFASTGLFTNYASPLSFKKVYNLAQAIKKDQNTITKVVKENFKRAYTQKQIIENLGRCKLTSEEKTTAAALIKNIAQTTDSEIAIMKKIKRESFGKKDYNHSHDVYLGWCECGYSLPETRQTVAFLTILKTVEKFDPKHHLSYTSLASGNFLQDYIILKELVQLGYDTLVANFIDTAYPKTLEPNSSRCINALYTKGQAREARNLEAEDRLKQKFSDQIQLLIIKVYSALADSLGHSPKGIEFVARYFSSTECFLSSHSGGHKTNVVLLVDPQEFERGGPVTDSYNKILKEATATNFFGILQYNEKDGIIITEKKYNDGTFIRTRL